MSNNRISCCCQVECAYLFLQTKVLGLDPVFTSPGIKFWTRSFLGYTGINGLTCGADLKDIEEKPLYSVEGITLTENIGISIDHQMWSDPKLITEIESTPINWGGSYNMQKKDFKYVIRGNLLLPNQYKGITLIKSSDIENGKLFYKYFGGNLPQPLYTNIRNCFNTIYDDRGGSYRSLSLSYPLNPGQVSFIENNASICEMYGITLIGISAPASDGTTDPSDETTDPPPGISFIYGITLINGITSINVFDGITLGDTGADQIFIDSKHIFNIKVDYSDDYSLALKNDNHIFYSIVPGNVDQEEQSPIAPGTFTPVCDPSHADRWCKGITLPNLRLGGIVTQGCYTIPPFKIDNKVQSNAFYQSLPENIMVYKVDVYRCQNEDGSSYLSLGDTKFVQKYTVQQVTPRSDEDEACPCSDLDGTDPKWDGLGNKVLLDDINGSVHKMCTPYYEGIPRYKCNPQAGTGKGIKWNKDSCEKIFEQECAGLSCDPQGITCADRLTTRIILTTWYKVREVYDLSGCEDVSDCLTYEAEYVPTVGRYAPITQEYTLDTFPGTGGRSQFRNDIITPQGGGCEWYELYTPQSSVEVVTWDQCTESGYIDIPTWSYEAKITYDCATCPDGTCPDGYQDGTWGPDQQYYRFFKTSTIDYDCCCTTPPNDRYVVVNQRKEETTYTINPYIMIDKDARYFDEIKGVSLPNFQKYILNYFEQWKNDREGLSYYSWEQEQEIAGRTLDNYGVYCDNPKCNLGFVKKPYEYFFWDKIIGVTAGELAIKSKSFCSNTFVWKTLPNPDYPCRSTYSYDISQNLPIPCYPNTTHKSSTYYDKLPESSIPNCWKQIKQQFPDGLALNDCSAITSIDFIQSIIDQLYN